MIVVQSSPCPGLTMYRTPEGQPFIFLHYKADPTLDEEKIKQLKKKFRTKARWNLEMEGDSEALGGTRVYPEWDESIHVIPDEKIPQRGCIYMSVDPHPRTPHACLWVLIDRWNDWYVYRDMWPSVVYGTWRQIKDDEPENQYSVREYCEYIAFFEGNEIEWHHAETDLEYGVYRRRPNGEHVIRRFMDQAGKAFRASGESELLETYARRYSKYGISCGDPRKSHQVGEDAIHALLRPRHVDETFSERMGAKNRTWPRLHVAESCRELRVEIANLRYKITKTMSNERDLKQETSEYRTHQVDNLRYLATSDACYMSRFESKRFQLF